MSPAPALLGTQVLLQHWSPGAPQASPGFRHATTVVEVLVEVDVDVDVEVDVDVDVDVEVDVDVDVDDVDGVHTELRVKLAADGQPELHACPAGQHVSAVPVPQGVVRGG